MLRIGPISFFLLVAGAGLPLQQLLAADGCAPGTFSTVHSPDGNATSFLFDDFHVISDTTQGPKRARCDLVAPIPTRKGFSVFAVDYRGFVIKNADQSVSVKSGRNRNSDTIYEPMGRVTADFAISRRLGSVDAASLPLSIKLTASGNPGDINPAELYLDTIDVSQIGFTTMNSVNASLDEVAGQRRDLINQLQSISAQMLGFSEPFAGDDYVSAFTGINGTTSFTARWNATDSLTLRGGIAHASLGGTEANADNAILFASSARYAVPLDAAWSVFGEVGGWAIPDLEAGYWRSYLDGNRLSSTTSRASGSMLGISARMGVVVTPDATNEIALSARVAHSNLNIDAYAEKSTANNLFAAHIAGRRSNLDAADIMVAWTHSLTTKIDYSLTASAGREFADHHAVSADVDWVGKARGGWDASYFGTLGARVGWQFRRDWSVETTVQADFRSNADRVWNLGIQLKAKF